MSIYDKNFYDYIADGAFRSANKIVPRLIEIFNPQTVIDFGCGTGAWLAAFKANGISTIYGVDGSDEGHQLLSDEEFEIVDLGKPYVPRQKYDLAVCLEVAEHVDEKYSDIFVANVARCSDNILWSAAVPGQRGLNHINEQWPSYWIPKFASYGFSCNGSFRYEFWNDEEIETWYRQNILLFSKTINWNEQVRDLVHPNNYSNYHYVKDEYKYVD